MGWILGCLQTHPIYDFSNFHQKSHFRNGHFEENIEKHKKGEFVKIRSAILVIIFVIFTQKWKFRIEIKVLGIQRSLITTSRDWFKLRNHSCPETAIADIQKKIQLMKISFISLIYLNCSEASVESEFRQSKGSGICDASLLN